MPWDHAMNVQDKVFRGGCVLTLSDVRPEPLIADLWIRDGKIEAIGTIPDLQDAEQVDASGRILMPGLVNAHQHCWQTAMRGVAGNSSLPSYLQTVHRKLAPKMTPEDMRISGLTAALNQLACGTTTIGDWCHNIPTADHVDAAIEGLASSGIRAVFFHGFPPAGPNGTAADITTLSHSKDALLRVLQGPLRQAGGLIDLGIAVLGPHYSIKDVAVADLTLAGELGLIASMHHSGGPARSPDGWEEVKMRQLLGPHVNIVHGNSFSDEELRSLIEFGVSFTVTPEVEMSAGHGEPITQRLLALGSSPSLGVDIESGISAEMVNVARFALAQQRAAAHAAAKTLGEPFATQLFSTSREALIWATKRGAQALGLDQRVGELSEGMQADIIMINPSDLNLAAAHDPYWTALNSSSHNIEAVLVNGEWKKKKGQLVGVDQAELLQKLEASRSRLVGED